MYSSAHRRLVDAQVLIHCCGNTTRTTYLNQKKASNGGAHRLSNVRWQNLRRIEQALPRPHYKCLHIHCAQCSLCGVRWETFSRAREKAYKNGNNNNNKQRYSTNGFWMEESVFHCEWSSLHLMALLLLLLFYKRATECVHVPYKLCELCIYI